ETGKEYEMSMERVFSPWKLKRILMKSGFSMGTAKTIGFLPKHKMSSLFPKFLRKSAYIFFTNLERNVLAQLPIIKNIGGRNIVIAKKKI
ncbi:MAG: hypothetical protein ACE5GL_11715, partial [Calditrichia bacterium]